MEKNTIENLRECCYEDLKGDAMSIVRLIIDAYSINHTNVSDLFSHISEDELNNRYFMNIDWKNVVKIATSALSRQETYNYLKRA